ncbi:sulfite exporter TauE/SafE family protein [Chloroflexota bacterium]
MNEYLILAIAALLVGLAKGGLGPVGALVVPLVSTMMPVGTATGLILPFLMVGDLFALRSYWRKWEMKHLRLMLPAAVIGIILGAWLLTSLPDDVLRRILGIFTLVIAIYKLANDAVKSLTYNFRPWHGYLAGGLAGFASALANAGGPPITAYLLLQKLSPTAFVGTSVLFFAIVNAIKLPIFITSGVLDVQLFLSFIWMALLIPLGVFAGHWIIKRISQRLFDALMLIFLFYTGFSLLFGGQLFSFIKGIFGL